VTILWSNQLKATVVLGLVLAVQACFGQNSDGNPLRMQRRVSVIEFADFQCPFCARQAPDLSRLRTEYSGKVDFVFKNFPLPFHKQSRPAHLAALAAGRQGKFWQMHDLIFDHPGHLSPEDFERYANELGLNQEEFKRSLGDPAVAAVIDKDTAEGTALGVSATPTFLVDGHKLTGRQSYATLKRIIDAELRSEPWPVLEKVSVNVAGAPFQGPESAPVTVVEFADFQCSFCARALAPLRQLLAANQGKVRFVFKNFPLESHPDSRLAHMAALAADEQGKFWEMHDLIYAYQSAMKRDDLLRFAAQLNLDMAKFQKDIDNPKLKTKIDGDRNEGESLGVVATPTFVVNGELLAGFSSEQVQMRIDRQASVAATRESDVTLPSPKLDLSSGPEGAVIKIRWYVDLTSPLTAQSAVALQDFVAAHHGNVLVEFKNFPLQNHSTAMLVHEFALAAAAQGKFWSIESLLLADPKPKDREELKILASQAGIDQSKLWAEVDAHKYASVISNDLVEAKRIGISGTPTFVVGDKKLDGVDGLAAIP
jgi:protein-disulfide isomerase